MAPPVIVDPSDTPAEKVRNFVQYIYPGLLLLVFVAVGALGSIYNAVYKDSEAGSQVKGPGGKPLPVSKSKKSPPDASIAIEFGPQASRFFKGASILTTISFFGMGIAITARSLAHQSAEGDHGWWCGEPKTVYVLGSAFLWLYFSLTLFDWDTSPYLVHGVVWSLALLGDLINVLCDAFVLSGPHKVMTNLDRNKYVVTDEFESWDAIDLGLSAIRTTLILGMVIVFTASVWRPNRRQRAGAKAGATPDETTPLICRDDHDDSASYHATERNDGHVTSRSRSGTLQSTLNDYAPSRNGSLRSSKDLVSSRVKGRSGSVNGGSQTSRRSARKDSVQSSTGANHPAANGSPPTVKSRGAQPVKNQANGDENGASSVNGGADAGSSPTQAEMKTGPMVDEEAGFYRPEKLPQTTWWDYLRGYSVFFPYMWPTGELRLQLIVVVCFALVLVQRGVNIMVPQQIGTVTNELSGDGYAPDEKFRMPWMQLGLLVLYKILQGPSGLLGSMRSLMWIPVSQHTYKALMTSAFEHVHSLSLDFHLGKRTGEVLSALNKGSSINSFLEQVTFQVFPIMLDLFVAITYFYIQFDAVYATIVCIITFYYLYFTIRMASQTADQRRAMSNLDREEEAVKNDSIISYETVKYFNAEKFEFEKYRKAVQNFQGAEAQVTWSMNMMNVVQSMTFMSGMLCAILFGAYQVSQRHRRVGDFVMLITYLGQIQGPLNFFGTFYRTVQQAMISGERLLELFKQQPSVKDRAGAVKLDKCTGHVEFDKVKFAYDPRKPALEELSFICKPGTTTALVGESGGGKSTLFRLLYRYFNCQSGSIRIDGRDVKDLTIDSLRKFIGVVPQDMILFNDTLLYNLQYANQKATFEEVQEACRKAAIHDRIMSFPDGYQTKVGERGLRLSGGEKQRVAIARTLLKSPKIIMLDEATSALDSGTEDVIQKKLALQDDGHTVLIIAHRLSTITHADQILVLNSGRIVEKGQHEELLGRGGHYANMWYKQAKATEAAKRAEQAMFRAKQLAQRAGMPERPDPNKAAALATESTSSSEHNLSGDESHGGSSTAGLEDSSIIMPAKQVAEQGSGSDKGPGSDSPEAPSPPPNDEASNGAKPSA